MNALVQTLASHGGKLLAELEAVYKDLHQHPELSMQELRTARIAADYIDALGFEVTREVGVTGVVGVLRNGAGPTVMLRADMDALPMAENTGLPYASTVKAKDEDGVEVGVAHSCGHDLHVTWLMGAARILAEHTDTWKGTVICCAECDASNAERPPEFTTLSAYPLTENDAAATARVAGAFKTQFGDKSYETAPASASEDFSIFGRTWNVPYVFWFVGGTDPEVHARAKAAKQVNKIPSNHSPKFAPVIHPTLETGLQAMLAAASAWLCAAPEA